MRIQTSGLHSSRASANRFSAASGFGANAIPLGPPRGETAAAAPVTPAAGRNEATAASLGPNDADGAQRQVFVCACVHVHACAH